MDLLKQALMSRGGLNHQHINENNNLLDRLKENKFYEYKGEQERLLGEILFNNFLIEYSNGNHFCFYSKIKFISVIRV